MNVMTIAALAAGGLWLSKKKAGVTPEIAAQAAQTSADIPLPTTPATPLTAPTPDALNKPSLVSLKYPTFRPATTPPIKTLPVRPPSFAPPGKEPAPPGYRWVQSMTGRSMGVWHLVRDVTPVAPKVLQALSTYSRPPQSFARVSIEGQLAAFENQQFKSARQKALLIAWKSQRLVGAPRTEKVVAGRSAAWLEATER